MKGFLSLLGLIAVAALFVLGGWLIFTWVYWWFAGLFQLGTIWFGVPWFATLIVIVAIAWLIPPAFLIFAITGFIGWTWTLNYSWVTGLLVYLPTIAFLLGSFVSVIGVAIIAGIAQLWSNTLDGWRR